MKPDGKPTDIEFSKLGTETCSFIEWCQDCPAYLRAVDCGCYEVLGRWIINKIKEEILNKAESITNERNKTNND